MKYHARAVSVVWTVCTAQPAARYQNEMSLSASQTFLSHPPMSTPRRLRTRTAMATPTSQAPTLTSLRRRDGSLNGRRRERGGPRGWCTEGRRERVAPRGSVMLISPLSTLINRQPRSPAMNGASSEQLDSCDPGDVRIAHGRFD